MEAFVRGFDDSQRSSPLGELGFEALKACCLGFKLLDEWDVVLGGNVEFDGFINGILETRKRGAELVEFAVG